MRGIGVNSRQPRCSRLWSGKCGSLNLGASLLAFRIYDNVSGWCINKVDVIYLSGRKRITGVKKWRRR
jgi:hypothetical protein